MWTATKDTTWLALSKSAGGAPDSTTVTLTPGTLAAGPHTGSVTVTAPGAAGSPKTVQVNFKITVPPNTPTNLDQFKSDGATEIPVGGNSNGASVVLKGTLSDSDATNTLTLEVEVQPVGTSFTNVRTGVSAAGASGTTLSVPVSVSVLLVQYHWQARTCDQFSRCSAWVSFPQPPKPTNSESAADFVGSVLP
jgi:hypothetical protein